MLIYLKKYINVVRSDHMVCGQAVSERNHRLQTSY